MNFSLIPIAHAQTVTGIINSVVELLNKIIPIIFAIATIVFLWGIVLFIISGGDEEKRKEGRQYIIYGLIGLFVMVAVWGIINVVIGFFDIGGFRAPRLPDLPGYERSFDSNPNKNYGEGFLEGSGELDLTNESRPDKNYGEGFLEGSGEVNNDKNQGEGFLEGSGELNDTGADCDPFCE